MPYWGQYTTGPKTGTVAFSFEYGGATLDWVNQSNALSDNDSYAAAILPAPIAGYGMTTMVLAVKELGFELPSQAVIKGLILKARVKASHHDTNYYVGEEYPYYVTGMYAGNGTTPKCGNSDVGHILITEEEREFWATYAPNFPTVEEANAADFFAGFYTQVFNIPKDSTQVTAYVDVITCEIEYDLGGYAHKILGVAPANIGKVMGIPTANIAKFNGV